MTNTQRFFYWVTRRPYRVIAVALAALAICAFGLTTLVKDTSVRAFIPAVHEALIADSKATEIFGLSGDTIAVAVVTTDGSSVFQPTLFSLIAKMSAQLAALPNIRPDRVMSLATESSISGADGVVSVEPYIDPYAVNDEFVSDSYTRWQSMPIHHGTLVSDNARGAIIIADLLDADLAESTYLAVLDIVEAVDSPDVEFHVAGPGAVSGYLSRYIDNDAKKLQPIVLIVVLGFIYLAFRRGAALPGPLLVVVGASVGSLGLMAWADIPYFAITNALPIVIVAIAVADGIHILSEYYRLRETSNKTENRELVVLAMTSMARPITLTTVTTIAGFLGIAATSIMPPITYFGIFAALGVLLAWVFSMFVLPNMMVVIDPGRSRAFKSWCSGRPSFMGQLLGKLGGSSTLRYRSTLTVFFLAALIATIGVTKLRVDRSQVDNFAEDEPIRIADTLINDRFSGSAFLNIVVESDEVDGLLQVRNMNKVRDLQAYFDGLPNVTKTVSIVDYVSHLHGAIEDLPPARVAARALPQSDATLAEALFVYEISADPTDLDEEIDSESQRALIRGVLDSHYFSQNRIVVESLQQYIEKNFDEPGLTASLTGDVNINHHWMQGLQSSHFQGVALSLVLVLIASVVVFRSLTAGLISVVPIVFTILALYASMGYLGIYLEPATSMFAAIALGVGVDFAIHLVDRLRRATAEPDCDLADAIARSLPPIARACLFNSLALGLGFSVLMASDLPTLIRFGGLVSLAAFVSYLTAIVIVPALFAVESAWSTRGRMPTRPLRVPMSLLLVAVVASLLSGNLLAAKTDADRIAEAVVTREKAELAERFIDMTLTNSRGRTEQRVAVVHTWTSDERRATRVTFLAPKKSRNVSFLSYDHQSSGTPDKRWMFLPAARKTRQIPVSQRGKSFLGTDFSYEDIQSELTFEPDDWQFGYAGQVVEDGRVRHRLTGTPKDPRIARQLGYGGFDALIDEDSWIPVSIDFVDRNNRPLKTIQILSVVLIDDIWTARHIVARNHQTGHKTEFVIRDIDYDPNLDESYFESQTLGRGLAN